VSAHVYNNLKHTFVAVTATVCTYVCMHMVIAIVAGVVKVLKLTLGSRNTLASLIIVHE
jgi:hypothetical protein